jgi:hypothetical protein
MAISHVPHRQFRRRVLAPLPSSAPSNPPPTLQKLRTGAGAHVI